MNLSMYGPAYDMCPMPVILDDVRSMERGLTRKTVRYCPRNPTIFPRVSCHGGAGGAGNWQANNTWAINDGGVTNFFDMRFEAVPEPSSIHLALISAGLLVAAGKVHAARVLAKRDSIAM